MNDPRKYAYLLNEIYAGREVKCPVCGNMLKHNFYAGKDHVGFAQFECTSCGETAHLSRIKFPPAIKVKEL